MHIFRIRDRQYSTIVSNGENKRSRIHRDIMSTNRSCRGDTGYWNVRNYSAGARNRTKPRYETPKSFSLHKTHGKRANHINNAKYAPVARFIIVTVNVDVLKVYKYVYLWWRFINKQVGIVQSLSSSTDKAYQNNNCRR